MRAIVSLVGLVLAVLVVLHLARTQTEALTRTPAVAPTGANATGTTDAGNSGAAAPVGLPRQVGQDVGRALEQGMAARASAVGR